MTTTKLFRNATHYFEVVEKQEKYISEQDTVEIRTTVSVSACHIIVDDQGHEIGASTEGQLTETGEVIFPNTTCVDEVIGVFRQIQAGDYTQLIEITNGITGETPEVAP